MRSNPLSRFRRVTRPSSGRGWALFGAVGFALLLAASPALAALAPRLRLNPDQLEPGLHADDNVKLINQRSITPAGLQTDLGDLPLNAILAPDGRHMLVSNSGAGLQSLQVVDIAQRRAVQTLPYAAPDSVFVGLAYSPDGSHAYASGGGSNVIHTYAVATDGSLTPGLDLSSGPKQTTPLGDAPWPSGLSLSPDGKTLYVANNLANSVGVIDTASGGLRASVPVGTFPYTTIVSHDGKRVYTSNWGDATLSAIDTSTLQVVGTITVGQHPSAMTWGSGDLLFVADSNSDAVSVVHTARGTETRRVSLAPYADAPLSTSPEGLAVSPDGRTLYVADAGADEIAVIDLDAAGEPGQVRGRIPTAWYPTAVVASNDGQSVYVTNAKGYGAGPNDSGLYPSPTRRNPPIVDALTGYKDGYCNCTFDQYSGSMIIGTLSVIDAPRSGRLAIYTSQVERNNRYSQLDRGLAAVERPPLSPLPLPGRTDSPIKHVIYIIKENRTFDQVFGDEQVGDADPGLVLFGQANTPNLHALAERFGVLDNFYADAEVSADGHNWATSANASDYNEKMWPQDYSPGAGRNRGYDFEGATRINLSPGGYLWDAAAEAGITYRDYGEFASNTGTPSSIPETDTNTCTGPIAHSYTGTTVPDGQVLCFGPTSVNPITTPNLVGHVDPRFRAYDLRFREADRVAEWQREFDQFVASDSLPQLELMRLPNDHTSGTTAGRPTPQAYVAENDWALGKVIDILSHSTYWSSTAVFVTEDDAQNGPDHVDAHRTTSLVISPYTSHDHVQVDHTLYDTAAMVRTMEQILGLRPLSQYDANATPMYRAFNSRIFLPASTHSPYIVLPESVPITQLNAATAFGAADSALMNFEVEDAAPMKQLNAILWHAVRGADVPYPEQSAGGSNADGDGL